MSNDVTNAEAAALRELEKLLDEYTAAMCTIAAFDDIVANRVKAAREAAIEEVEPDRTSALNRSEQLRRQILAKATEYRALLAGDTTQIKLNNGLLKWHTTTTWVIDVSDKVLLKLIRRLRVMRFVGKVVYSVSKEKLNQHPWIYPRLEKRGAAHRQQTTSFLIAPNGFTSDPKNDPNKIVAETKRIHEE